MDRDKSYLPVSFEQRMEAADQFGMRRHIQTMLVVSLEAGGPLLVLVVGLPGRRVVGDMQVHGNG